jgi:hypothetical protein
MQDKLIIENFVDGVIEKMAEYGIPANMAPAICQAVLAKNDLLARAIVGSSGKAGQR